MIILSVFGTDIRLIVILSWQVEIKNLFSEKLSIYMSFQQSSLGQKYFYPFLVYRFFSLDILSVFCHNSSWTVPCYRRLKSKTDLVRTVHYTFILNNLVPDRNLFIHFLFKDFYIVFLGTVFLGTD